MFSTTAYTHIHIHIKDKLLKKNCQYNPMHSVMSVNLQNKNINEYKLIISKIIYYFYVSETCFLYLKEFKYARAAPVLPLLEPVVLD